MQFWLIRGLKAFRRNGCLFFSNRSLSVYAGRPCIIVNRARAIISALSFAQALDIFI